MRKRPIEASTRRVENSPINRGGEKLRKITPKIIKADHGLKVITSRGCIIHKDGS